jgi:hypothetical protein
MNALSALERAGWISRERQQGGNKSTRYVLHLDRAADALGHDVHLARAGDAPELGHDMHQGRAPDAPEPSVNRQIEPSCNLRDALRCADASLARDGRKIGRRKRSDAAVHHGVRSATRIAQDWQPSIDDRRFAEQLGLYPDRTAERFRDYWIAQPRQRGVKADWSATGGTGAAPRRSEGRRKQADRFEARALGRPRFSRPASSSSKAFGTSTPTISSTCCARRRSRPPGPSACMLRIVCVLLNPCQSRGPNGTSIAYEE